MKYVIILSISLLLTSCNNSKKRGNDVEYKYYDNGVMCKEIHQKKGIPEGLAIFYFKSGLISAIGNFRNGLAEGKWIRYYDSEGLVGIVENYRSGKRQGVFYQFFPSGYLHIVSNFNNDSLCCSLTEYHNNRDAIYSFYPDVKSNGDAFLYIRYDTAGEAHFYKTRRDQPQNFRLSINKISPNW